MRTWSTRHRQLIPIVIALAVPVLVAIIAETVTHGQIAMINSAGTIADQQRNLLFIVTGLMMLIIIPIFILTFMIVWKYRATNTKANYQPDWDRNNKLEITWWTIPICIIAIIAVLAWISTRHLDPSRHIASSQKPLVVQVVALQWKWLFLYPDQHVASVNYVNFPANRPVEFDITSDAPMNSFWIPRLGGQIYAMSGMTTKLNLMADRPGSYHGSSANISGNGFASMDFIAEATTPSDFNKWVAESRQSTNSLTLSAYTALSRPTVVNKPLTYRSFDADLFNQIIDKYNDPGALAEESN